MYICLLRHGETDWNNVGKLQGREDVPLNTAGIEQIKEASHYLNQFNWKIIITSPLSRAKASAEIISQEIGNIPIYENVDFIERDYGKASGMTPEERKLNFPDGKWIGMEAFETLQNRTVNALMKCIKEYEGKDIIIASHGAAIHSIVAYLSNNEIDIWKIIPKNASMTLLKKANDKFEIIFFNKTAKELIEN